MIQKPGDTTNPKSTSALRGQSSHGGDKWRGEARGSPEGLPANPGNERTQFKPLIAQSAGRALSLAPNRAPALRPDLHCACARATSGVLALRARGRAVPSAERIRDAARAQ